jgi:hypothetical protein
MQALLIRGRALEQQGLIENALEDFEKAQAID